MAHRVLWVLLLVVLSVSVLPSLPDVSGFAETGRISGVGTIYSGVVDTASGFAYFAQIVLPHSIVVKVRLSDFTIANSLTLTSGFANGLASVVDPAAGYLYYATFPLDGVTNYARIVRVRLSDFSENATLNTPIGDNSTGAAVIDPAGGFAYFTTGHYQQPGVILKVRLSDFTLNNTMALNPGEYDIASAVIDTAAGYAYFGTFASPAHIIRVRLSDFTRQGTVQLTGGETYLSSAVIDTAGGFAYFGTHTSPGIIVKIRLSDFTRANGLVLNSGENSTDTAVIDTAGGYAYFGTYTSAPSSIVKIRLSDFTRATALALKSDEGYPRGAIIDTAGFAYFATFQCCTGGTYSYIIKVQVASASSAPQTLQASGGSGNVTLSWIAPSFNGDRSITGYKIYRGTSSGTEASLGTIGNLTSYHDNPPSSSATYYYRVTALNNFGESAFSNEASASPGSPGLGSVFGLPALAFYGLIGIVIAVIAILTVLFLRKRMGSKKTVS